MNVYIFSSENYLEKNNNNKPQQMLSLFQMLVSDPNQHPALKVLWLTLLLARQSAVNYSPRAQPSGGTHISQDRFFETFPLGHCYFIVFVDMKSVFTEGSFLLQSCTDIDLYFVRLLYNMISEGILQFTMSIASYFYTEPTGVA